MERTEQSIRGVGTQANVAATATFIPAGEIIAIKCPLSMRFPQARTLEWLPFPPPGDLPNPEIEDRSNFGKK